MENRSRDVLFIIVVILAAVKAVPKAKESSQDQALWPESFNIKWSPEAIQEGTLLEMNAPSMLDTSTGNHGSQAVNTFSNKVGTLRQRASRSRKARTPQQRLQTYDFETQTSSRTSTGELGGQVVNTPSFQGLQLGTNLGPQPINPPSRQVSQAAMNRPQESNGLTIASGFPVGQDTPNTYIVSPQLSAQMRNVNPLEQNIQMTNSGSREFNTPLVSSRINLQPDNQAGNPGQPAFNNPSIPSSLMNTQMGNIGTQAFRTSSTPNSLGFAQGSQASDTGNTGPQTFNGLRGSGSLIVGQDVQPGNIGPQTGKTVSFPSASLNAGPQGSQMTAMQTSLQGGSLANSLNPINRPFNQAGNEAIKKGLLPEISRDRGMPGSQESIGPLNPSGFDMGQTVPKMRVASPVPSTQMRNVNALEQNNQIAKTGSREFNTPLVPSRINLQQDNQAGNFGSPAFNNPSIPSSLRDMQMGNIGSQTFRAPSTPNSLGFGQGVQASDTGNTGPQTFNRISSPSSLNIGQDLQPGNIGPQTVKQASVSSSFLNAGPQGSQVNSIQTPLQGGFSANSLDLATRASNQAGYEAVKKGLLPEIQRDWDPAKGMGILKLTPSQQRDFESAAQAYLQSSFRSAQTGQPPSQRRVDFGNTATSQKPLHTTSVIVALMISSTILIQ